MNTPTLGSILLGSPDPQRLLDWYCAAFDCTPNDVGFLPFGATDVLIDGRADVGPVTREPGRVILNFHVDNARRTAAHLDELGVSWLVALEERRDGLFGTLVDPDGNYIQIIQLSTAYIASRKA
ncbi:MAG: VOC family protein [Gemmatimonadaceae bacterium]